MKIFQIFLSIFIGAVTLYLCIEKQNELNELRLSIPALEKEVKKIKEENTQLQYEIDQFESPLHLMELLRKPEFSHLRFPALNEVIVIPVQTDYE